MSASHRKSTQVHASPGQMESQVDPSSQLAATCDSVWPGLTYGLKDLLTVDLFSVYLLSRVDIVIRYIELYFTFELPGYVCYIEEFCYIEVLFHTFYCNFGRNLEYRSLYRGLR